MDIFQYFIIKVLSYIKHLVCFCLDGSSLAGITSTSSRVELADPMREDSWCSSRTGLHALESNSIFLLMQPSTMKMEHNNDQSKNEYRYGEHLCQKTGDFQTVTLLVDIC